MITSRGRAPWWLILIAVVMALPVFRTPALIAACPPEPEIVRTLVMIYPIYVIVTAWLACICWPQRKTMTWILLALMALSSVAIHLLVYSRL